MPMETIISDDESLTDAGFFWREAGEIRLLVCRRLENAGFANGFSTRLGGVSPFPDDDLNLAGFNEDTRENIYENRRRFLKAFESNYKLAIAWQVHGDNILVVNSLDEAIDADTNADAVVSNVKGVLAGAKTADCVPVLVGDPATNSFAAIHAGWRGTATKIVTKTVAELSRRYNADPHNMIAAIGPAAGRCFYEVGQDVIDAFRDHPDHEKYFTPTRDEHAFVDLHQANRDQLVLSGLSNDNIYTAPFDTMERTDLFFSYRREKAKFGKTGRLLSVIGQR